MVIVRKSTWSSWILAAIILTVGLTIAISFTSSVILKPIVATLLIGFLAVFMFIRRLPFECQLTPLSIVIRVWILLHFISFLLSNYLFFSFQRGSEVLTWAIFALLIGFLLKKPVDVYVIAGAFVVLGFVASIYGLLQKFDLSPFAWDQIPQVRVTSTFGNGTYFAGFLAVVIPLTVYIALSWQKWLFKTILFLMAGVMFWVLLYTFGRMGVVLTVLGLMFVVILRYHSLLRTLQRKLIFMVSSLVLVWGVWFILPHHLQTRFINILTFSDASAQGRGHIWQGTVDMIGDRPFFGWGIGLFFQYFPQYRPNNYREWGMEDFVTHAHNEILEVTAELGFIGLIVFLALIGITYWQIWQIIWQKTHQNMRKWGILLAILLAIIFLDGLISVNFRTTTGQMLWWSCLGVINWLYLYLKLPLIKKVILSSRISIGIGVFLLGLLIGYGYLQFQVLRSDHHLYRGWVLLRHQRMDLAIDELKKATEKNPNNLYAYYQLGVAYFSAEKYLLSLETFESLREKSPFYPEVIKNIGLVYKQLGEQEKAITFLKKSLTFNDIISTHFSLAKLYYQLGDTSQLLSHLSIYLPRAALQYRQSSNVEIYDELKQASQWLVVSGKSKEDQISKIRLLEQVHQISPELDFIKTHLDTLKNVH